jgi:hypothetical protein
MRGGMQVATEGPAWVAPEAAPPETLQARWSNWWGSPQLYAHLVTRITREAGGRGSTRIVFRSDTDEETFDSVEAFLARVSPEVLRSFGSAECTVRGSACAVDLRMDRSSVTVDVTGAKPHDVQSALARIIAEANRGYRPFWGPASWPSDVAPRSRYQRLGGHLRDLFDFAVAAAFGVASMLAATHISGADDHPGWAMALIALLGGGIGFVVNRAVPAVEIAANGRTRFRVISTRLAASAGGWIGAQVLAFLGG